MIAEGLDVSGLLENDTILTAGTLPVYMSHIMYATLRQGSTTGVYHSKDEKCNTVSAQKSILCIFTASYGMDSRRLLTVTKLRLLLWR